MKRGIIAVAVLTMGGMVGCQPSMPDPNSTVAQLEFDLTVNEDRARFVEDGLAYQGSVGPYAVYKVTAENPRLIGPYIQVTTKVGYAMLCGATHYFTPALQAASLATLHLHGGQSGLVPLVQTDQMPSDEGGCTQPKDTFGNPIPDGGAGDNPGGGGTPGTGGGTPGTGGGTPGTGGGTPGTGGGTPGTGGGTPGGGGTNPGTPGGGTTGCDNPDGCGTGTGTPGGGGTNPGTGTGTGTPGTGGGGANGGAGGTGGVPCTNPDPAGCNPSGSTGTGGAGSGANAGGGSTGTSSDPVIQRLNITFSNPPKVGSTVLLRRVALTGARQHNQSHIIPNICCKSGQCSLSTVQ
jgi:hypothetical protein